MTSALLKYILEYSLPRCYLDPKRVLLSATHVIFLYVYLQHNISGVDFLLYWESHLLPRIDFECEIGLWEVKRFRIVS